MLFDSLEIRHNAEVVITEDWFAVGTCNTATLWPHDEAVEALRGQALASGTTVHVIDELSQWDGNGDPLVVGVERAGGSPRTIDATTEVETTISTSVDVGIVLPRIVSTLLLVGEQNLQSTC